MRTFEKDLFNGIRKIHLTQADDELVQYVTNYMKNNFGKIATINSPINDVIVDTITNSKDKRMTLTALHKELNKGLAKVKISKVALKHKLEKYVEDSILHFNGKRYSVIGAV